MASGNLPLTVRARRRAVFTLEGKTNPWPAVLLWLEHRNPAKKPRDPSKTISAALSLQWSPTPTAPGGEAWRQAVTVTNETSDDQEITVHFYLADGADASEIEAGAIAESDLDG